MDIMGQAGKFEYGLDIGYYYRITISWYHLVIVVLILWLCNIY